MNTPILSGEKAAEYTRLYTEYGEAMVRAAAALKAHGMASEEFRQADAAAGTLWGQTPRASGHGWQALDGVNACRHIARRLDRASHECVRLP
jgi:hypothetical protein